MVKAMADLKDGTTEIKSTENLKAGLDEVNAKYKSQAQAKARNLLQKKSSTPMNNGQDPKGNLHVDSQSTPVHNEEVTDTPGSVSSREGQVLYGPQRYINADTPKTLHNKDIEKLYPSIRAARAGELVRQEVQKTELLIEYNCDQRAPVEEKPWRPRKHANSNSRRRFAARETFSIYFICFVIFCRCNYS